MKRYIKPPKNPKAQKAFIMIALPLVFLAHYLYFNGIQTADVEGVQIPQMTASNLELAAAHSESGNVNYSDYSAQIDADRVVEKAYEPKGLEIQRPEAAVEAANIEIVKPEYEPLVVEGKPKIAIVIDDMGVSRRNSLAVAKIDAPLTLAFLPYAKGLSEITDIAKREGHELMIHMPMQATTNPVSLGPIAIKSGMNEGEVRQNMREAFATFEGYVGLNNHMGSKVTQDQELMGWVMQALKEEGLYFLDSRTIGSSVAADISMQYGLPTATRDVFLDHEDSLSFVRNALLKTEKVAARKGYAIAIGHPKKHTIRGLQEWVDDVRSRGFEIVHASELMSMPSVTGEKVTAVQTGAEDIVEATKEEVIFFEKPVVKPEEKKVAVIAEPKKEPVKPKVEKKAAPKVAVKDSKAGDAKALSKFNPLYDQTPNTGLYAAEPAAGDEEEGAAAVIAAPQSSEIVIDMKPSTTSLLPMPSEAPAPLP